MPTASSEVPDITGNSTRDSSHHDCGIINETADKDAGLLTSKLNECSNLLEEEGDDDDDPAMLLNDICKIRALGMIQSQTTVNSVSSSIATASTVTKMERSHNDLTTRPGSYSVAPGTLNTTQSNGTTLDDISISGSNDRDDGEIQETDSSLCEPTTIPAAMVATEHDTIYQRVLENVTANAVVANVVGMDNNSENNDSNTGNVGDTNEWRRKYSRSRLCQCIAFVTIVGIGIMVTMGVLLVVRRRADAASINGSEGDSGPLTTVATLPSSAPSTSRDDGVFYTTQELYEAVDAYLIALNTSMAPETSDVAVRYGYPMNAWNVSLLTNFTRVFDPGRNIEFNPFEKPPVYPANMTPMNEDLSQWDVSNADTMYGMFAYASGFQGVGVDNWDTSNVKDLSFTFYHAYAFNNTDLGKWNTSRVTSLHGTFFSAMSFTSDISTWDISSVLSMSNMFGYAVNFPGTNLELWDVSNVQDMNAMFIAAQSFNGNVSGWNTSKVVSMSYMFSDAFSFNGDLSSWSVGNVVKMDYMFSKTSLTGRWDLSKWDTSRVMLMIGMFSGATSFTGNVSTWDVSKVVSMEGAFSGCTSFNGDLSQWDTGQVQNMDALFMDASMFAGNLSQWDTSNVLSMRMMFSGAKEFDSDISGWNMSSVKDVTRMFSEAASFNESLCEWRNSLPISSEVTNMFEASACTDQADPVLGNPMNTSFCTPC